MHSQILISFFAYFCVLLAIGIISHKKQTSSTDFIMGNRSLNFWLTALSAHASDMSAWLFMGFPAAIFLGGFSKSWIAIGLVGGMFFNWQFVAKKLRTATEKYDSYTLSTYFERRFTDHSGTLRILTATICVFFLISYLAAGLIAMGLLFESIFKIDYYIGLSLATFVVVVYTVFGGFHTVAWTDLFQALFLLAVIVFVPFVAYMELPNGVADIQAVAEIKNISLSLFDHPSKEAMLANFFLICWGLGYFGQPHIVTKFMGIKSADDIYKAKYVGMTWQIMTLLAASAVGLIGIAFFAEGAQDAELVFVSMVKILFNPLVAGFILCAVLAANMSTMDSQILVCASILSEDFYKRMVGKEASPKKLLMISRLSVVFVSLFSLALAFNKNSTVLEAVEYAWSGLGASFGPLVLMSLYSKRANRYGAVAGILVGSIVAGGWHFVNDYFSEYTIPAMLPAFFLSLTSIYLISALTDKYTQVSCQEEMGQKQIL
ncbi:MAG TPA: sodium/proline symporter [Parachlamydiaceae bacterium]|nr:sodium/proline symporter [Parachlamydiaceae bacterium]